MSVQQTYNDNSKVSHTEVTHFQHAPLTLNYRTHRHTHSSHAMPLAPASTILPTLPALNLRSSKTIPPRRKRCRPEHALAPAPPHRHRQAHYHFMHHTASLFDHPVRVIATISINQPSAVQALPVWTRHWRPSLPLVVSGILQRGLDRLLSRRSQCGQGTGAPAFRNFLRQVLISKNLSRRSQWVETLAPQYSALHVCVACPGSLVSHLSKRSQCGQGTGAPE